MLLRQPRSQQYRRKYLSLPRTNIRFSGLDEGQLDYTKYAVWPINGFVCGWSPVDMVCFTRDDVVGVLKIKDYRSDLGPWKKSNAVSIPRPGTRPRALFAWQAAIFEKRMDFVGAQSYGAQQS